jgi:hypothetical protein
MLNSNDPPRHYLSVTFLQLQLSSVDCYTSIKTIYFLILVFKSTAPQINLGLMDRQTCDHSSNNVDFIYFYIVTKRWQENHYL